MELSVFSYLKKQKGSNALQQIIVWSYYCVAFHTVRYVVWTFSLLSSFILSY